MNIFRGTRPGKVSWRRYIRCMFQSMMDNVSFCFLSLVDECHKDMTPTSNVISCEHVLNHERRTPSGLTALTLHIKRFIRRPKTDLFKWAKIEFHFNGDVISEKGRQTQGNVLLPSLRFNNLSYLSEHNDISWNPLRKVIKIILARLNRTIKFIFVLCNLENQKHYYAMVYAWLRNKLLLF